MQPATEYGAERVQTLPLTSVNVHTATLIHEPFTSLRSWHAQHCWLFGLHRSSKLCMLRLQGQDVVRYGSLSRNFHAGKPQKVGIIIHIGQRPDPQVSTKRQYIRVQYQFVNASFVAAKL